MIVSRTRRETQCYQWSFTIKEPKSYEKGHFEMLRSKSISGNNFGSAVETQHPFPSFVNKSFEELELRKKRLVKMPREIKEIKVRHRNQS